MRRTAVLAVLLAGWPAAQAADIDALHQALLTSDTGAVERFVTDHYREAGISVNDTLTWERQAFDEIVNWYNQHTEVIRLSELPRADQAAAYWQNWTAVLTADRWDWQGFFVDDAEAALMANFNQFLVAAHEYGHALTYRYDPEHEQRHDNEINCREYLADRLAAALLEEVAEADPRLAALRQRYRALITEINAAIDPAHRYEVPGFAALDADCRIMHVEQPTDEASMVPYASAFFARHGVLLDTDLPPLRDIYATHLLPRWRAAQPPSSGRAGAVTTAAVLPPRLAAVDTTFDGRVYKEAAPAMDGTLYDLEIGIGEDWPPRFRLAYGRIDQPLAEVVPDQRLPIGVRPGNTLFFSNALSLGPDQVVLLTNAVGDKEVWLFSARRIEGRWHLSTRQIGRTDTYFPRLAFDAEGRVNAFLNERKDEETFDTRMRWLRIDAATLETTEMGIIPGLGEPPIALLADGSPLGFSDAAFVLPNPDGGLLAYAGSGLQGFKDSTDPFAAEIAAVNPMVLPDPDGGIRFIDYDPARDTLVLRRVAPAQ
jgi:hypothetical protein